MGTELSIGLDLFLAVFTLLYLGRLLFGSKDEGMLNFSGGVPRVEKRSLMNQHVARRELAAR